MGEQIAERYLKEAGYRILDRNYRWRGGEVDLIAKDGDEFVFVEVKNWSTFGFEEMERAIDAKKRQKIIQTSQIYLSNHQIQEDVTVRFDVIYLNGSRTVHLKSAFTES